LCNKNESQIKYCGEGEMKRSNRVSKQHNFMQVVAYSLMGCMFLTSLISVVMADADPLPGTLPSGVLGVPEGSVGSFDYSPGRLDIKDVAHQTVINWNNFDIGSGAVTQFHQLGGPSSAVMNRIHDGSPTGIYGSLLANGRVFIINPAGVIFGPGSTINVTQLVASSLKMTDQDFLNATNVVNPIEMRFELLGDGVVENYGIINAADSVYLVGKNVLNAGTIISPGGLVVLAAGEEVWLAQPGSDVVVKKLAAPSQQDHTVINSGTIEAAGGEIVLAAGDVFSNAVDVPEAGGVGRVGQFGTLSADGVDGDGGSINMTAGEVVALGSESLTTANAGENGDGGEVIVYSPDTALFWEGAKIEAKGGSESGDGGFIEISGKQNIEIWGLVDTTALHGATGIFLIDPYNLSIVTGTAGGTGWSGGNPDVWESTNTLNQLGVTTLLSHLDNANVTVQTGTGSSADGDITVDAAIDYSNATYNNLTLRAHDDITVNYPITAGTHNLTLEADVSTSGPVVGDVSLYAALNSTTGDITIYGDNFTSNSSGTITTTTGGNVQLDFTGGITTNAAINASSGAISLTSDSIALGSAITTTGAVTLQPATQNRSIGIGGAAGDYSLSTAEIAAITNNASSITIGRSNGQHTIAINAITFNDPVTIRTPSGGSIAVNGQITGADNASITLDGSGATTTLNANIVTSGNPITISDSVTLNAATILLDTTNSWGSAGAAIGITGAVAGGNHNLTLISGNGATTMGGALNSISTLTLQGNNAGATGPMTFNGDVTAATVTTYGQNYAVAFNEDTTITNDLTFANTGGVTLGDGDSDTLLFNNGLDTTAGNTTGRGRVRTSGDQMDIGALTISGGTLVLDTTNSGGTTAGANLNVGAVTGGGNNLTVNSGTGGDTTISSVSNAGTLTVTQSDDTTFNGAVGATTITLTDTDNVISFNGDVTATTFNTAGQGYSVAFNEDVTINNDLTFQNTGGVTLGNGDDDILRFNGGLSTTAGNTTGRGSVRTSGDQMDIGALAISGGTLTLDTTNNGGTPAGNNLNVGAVTGGGNNLTVNSGTGGDTTISSVSNAGTLTVTQSDDTTFNGAVGATTITLTDTGDDIIFNGNVTATMLNTAPQTYSVAFNEDATITDDLTFANTGGVTLGNGSDDILLFNGGLDTTAGATTGRGAVRTSGDQMDIGALTISDGTLVLDTTNNWLTPAGAPLNVAGAVTGGNHNLTLISGNSATTMSGALNSISTLALQGNNAGATGGVTFNGNVNASTVTTYARPYSVAFNEDATISSDLTFNNNGGVTLGDEDSDILLFNNGLDTTAGNTTGRGKVRTSGDRMDIGTLTISGGTLTLDTTNGGGSDNGATLNVGAVTGGGYNLTLNSGDDGDTTIASVSDAGALTVTNSDDTTINGAVSAASMSLNARQDITTNGPINLAGHLEMLGGQSDGSDNININESITAGSIRIKNGSDTQDESSMSSISVNNGSVLTSTVGDIVLQTIHDMFLTGAVSAKGNLFLNADENGHGGAPGSGGYDPYHSGGGDVIAGSTLEAGGNMDIQGNDIQLNGDVSANGGNLNITGRTSRDGTTGWGNIDVAAGKTLYAKNNVTINDLSNPAGQPLMTLTGHTLLTIVADTGAISALDTVIQVLGSELILEQGANLNTDNFLFAHQGETDLKLISNNGSVTSVETGLRPQNAADQWKSIGATAFDDITLSGNSGNIMLGDSGEDATKSLWAKLGDIDVTSAYDIEAAKDLSSGSDMTLQAGDDVIAHGNLDAGGNISIDSSVETIYLGGDHVVAVGNVLLNDNTELNGGVSQRIEATTGTLTAAGNVDKTTDGDLNLNGGSGIYLAGNVTTHDGDLTFEDNVTADGSSDQRFDAYIGKLVAEDGVDIDKSTAGSLTLGGDVGIVLGGNVTTLNGDLIFGDNVLANGGSSHKDQRFDAGTVWASEYKALIVQADISKTTEGSLTLDAGRGDSEIRLAGNVTTLNGDLIFEDDVVANGTGNQRLDAGAVWASEYKALIAQEDIRKTTEGSLTLDAGRGNSEIRLAGNVTTLNGDLIFEDRVVANGDGAQRFDAGTVWASDGKALIAQEDISKTTEGSLTLDAGRGDSEIRLAGNVTTFNGDLIFEDRVIANGSGSPKDQRFDAGTTWHSDGKALIAQEDISKTTEGSLTLDAGRGNSEIRLAGNVTTLNGDLIFEDRVVANGDGAQRFDAGTVWASDGKALIAQEDIDKTTDGSLTLDAGRGDSEIRLAGNVTTHDGDLIFEDDVVANGGNSPKDQLFDARGRGSDLWAYGDIRKITDGALTLDAGRGCHTKIYLYGDVTTHDGDLTFEDKVIAKGQGSQKFDASGLGKRLYAYDDIIKVTSGNLTLDGGWVPNSYAIELDGDVIVTGGHGKQWGNLILGNEHSYDNTTVADGKKLKAYDDIKVYGDLHGEGDLSLYAGDHTIQLWGDVDTVGNLLLNANTEFKGWFDQHVDVGGMLTANGWLKKLNGWGWLWSSGSLYLHAYGDIMLADDVTAAICNPCICWCVGGGVSIISETGRIYTPCKDVDGRPALAIDITGRSDQFGCWGPIGVDLPYGDGKAAIVIQSAEDLVLHRWSDLRACGTYYAECVDDRVGVGFLAEPGVSIGGEARDEGDAFDAAIYVGSTAGDVHLGGEVDIISRELTKNGGKGCGWQCVRRGAMIADAYDTVSFGTKFEDSLADGRVGDRLEVCSRITEWLEDAVGRLPFPADLTLPEGYNYVMRGAGLENSSITDGRAWVLESRAVMSVAPIGGLLSFGVENAGLGGGGCPALMTWLSNELGVDEEGLQVYLANAFVYSTDCQPCVIAAKLRDLAVVLEDPEGTGIAALAQVISEFVTTPAPPSEEEMAAIAERLASHIGDETYYAAAEQWIDALVAYVGVLTDEMGWSADKAIAFVMENYGSPVTDSGNAALTAYVQARLAASGGGVL